MLTVSQNADIPVSHYSCAFARVRANAKRNERLAENKIIATNDNCRAELEAGKKKCQVTILKRQAIQG